MFCQLNYTPVYMAEVKGFEPILNESKSFVLPLHYTSIYGVDNRTWTDNNLLSHNQAALPICPYLPYLASKEAILFISGGHGKIRTCEPLLGVASLAVKWFKPYSPTCPYMVHQEGLKPSPWELEVPYSIQLNYWCIYFGAWNWTWTSDFLLMREAI